MTKTALSVPQSTNSHLASVREQSTSRLQAAIHGHNDEGATLQRVNAVLGLYFDPDFDAQTKAAVREEFVRALAGKPQWAVQRAFDQWVKTGSRRPTPNEICILVDRELRPMAEELARRDAERREAEAAREAAQKARVTPEAAARIMAEAGMTPDRLMAVRKFPCALGMDDAVEMDAPQPLTDWTQGLAADDPRLMALRKSRAESVVVRQ